MKATTNRLAALVSLLVFVNGVQAQEHEHPPQPSESTPDAGSSHEGHQMSPDTAGHEGHDMPHDASGHHGHAMSGEPGASEREHVPPDPPSQEMHDMPYEQMAEMMAMDDTEPVGSVILDQLEARNGDDADLFAWDAQAWYGTDYDKLWLKAEGDVVDGSVEEARTEALWDRVVARWWSLQAGVRHDFGEGPSRTWAAFGVQGLAPWFFEVEATAYAGEDGRTAARLSGEYDLLLTQRWILQPEAEINLYGKSDPRNGIGSGLSDLQLGLRLRYEIRREFAPYLGVVWTRQFGRTADFARDAGHDASDVQVLAGLRVWF